MYMEDKYNEANRNRADAHQWAATVPDEGRTESENLLDDGYRRADAEDGAVYGQASGRDGRGTDVRCGENRRASEVTER